MHKYLKIFGIGVSAVVICFALVINSANAVSEQYDAISEYKQIEKTEAGLNAYKDKVEEKTKQLAERKVDNIAATITFSKPISYEELQQYIATHELAPKQIQARGIIGDERLTVYVAKPQDNMHEIVLEQLKQAEFIGYLDMYTILDWKQIQAIESDSLTFLVDTSGDSYFTGSDDKEEFPHALSWLKEDLENKK